MMTRREYWEREIGPGRRFATADVARICGVKQRTVQRWISEGRLFALGSSDRSRFEARVPREALLEFLIRRSELQDYPRYVEA